MLHWCMIIKRLNKMQLKKEVLYVTDSAALKKCIAESGISISFTAKKMGITREGFYKKLNGDTEFKASEISCIKNILGLSANERDRIFFANEVELNATVNC